MSERMVVDEEATIHMLAMEFIKTRGDELWKMCCARYGWNNADVRKQNTVMIGLHLGFQAAMATVLSAAKGEAKLDDLSTSSAENPTQEN